MMDVCGWLKGAALLPMLSCVGANIQLMTELNHFTMNRENDIELVLVQLPIRAACFTSIFIGSDDVAPGGAAGSASRSRTPPS